MNYLQNVSYQAMSGNNVELTMDIVKNIIASGQKDKISDADIFSFMKLCEHQKLDPFIKEAHLIKYGDNIQMVVGIDVFTNRLNEHPLCEGWQAGLILQDKNEIKETKGTFHLGEEKIVGAWMTIDRKGWKNQFYWSICFNEYFREYYDKDKKKMIPMGQWANMPATMIVKCVISSGCRKAFSKAFSGMYAPEEMGININEDGNIIDVDFEQIPNQDDNKNKNSKNTNSKKENKKPDELYISEYQINILKESATSKRYQLDSSKVLNYVIEEMIKRKLLRNDAVDLTKIQANKYNEVLKAVKETVLAKEKKIEKLNENNSDDSLPVMNQNFAEPATAGGKKNGE